MNERERLIKLLGCKYNCVDRNKCLEDQADNLLRNGVIVPPVKIGDKVDRISFTRVTRMKYIQETTISRVAIDYDGLWLFCSCNPIAKCKFGELVFLTKEQAEKALKGESMSKPIIRHCQNCEYVDGFKHGSVFCDVKYRWVVLKRQRIKAFFCRFFTPKSNL